MKREEPSSMEDNAEVQDRGIPPVNRVRSMQARVSALLAMSVSVLLCGAFLGWYYWGRLPGDAPAPAPKRRAAHSTDSALPPLARPRLSPSTESAVEEKSSEEPPAVEVLLGPAPPLNGPAEHDPQQIQDCAPTAPSDTVAPLEVGTAKPFAVARARSGPAFISLTDRTATAETSTSLNEPPSTETSRGAQLSRSLISNVVPTARAQLLPDLRFLLPKGDSIDCTLETAVDTALPSLVTCIAASDTYSADGSVVLVPRGAKVFGETRTAQTDAGARVFVVWNEVRSGSVVARLDSPATDAQGRGGLPGYVDRHFWARFGAAFLVSLIDGGINAASASRDREAAVIVNPEHNNALLTEVLRSTADIRPTVGVLPGARVKVLIARDVDFSSVYEITHGSR